MPRARNIKPALFKNELLGTQDAMVTLLFISLWTLADRRGILEDRPLRIKAETFPYREDVKAPDVNGYLTVLQQLGFIRRYEACGMRLIHILNFEKHQSPHKTERPSSLPQPPVESDSCPVTDLAPLDNGVSPMQERSDSLIPDSLIPEDVGRKKSPAKRSQRLKHVQLPTEWRTWAMVNAPDVDADHTWEVFADYWRAQPGQKGVKADWLATWRNWVRREAKNHATDRTAGHESRADRAARMQREAEQRATQSWATSGGMD
jgi:hypothetical protein